MPPCCRDTGSTPLRAQDCRKADLADFRNSPMRARREMFIFDTLQWTDVRLIDSRQSSTSHHTAHLSPSKSQKRSIRSTIRVVAHVLTVERLLMPRTLSLPCETTKLKHLALRELPYNSPFVIGYDMHVRSTSSLLISNLNAYRQNRSTRGTIISRYGSICLHPTWTSPDRALSTVNDEAQRTVIMMHQKVNTYVTITCKEMAGGPCHEPGER